MNRGLWRSAPRIEVVHSRIPISFVAHQSETEIRVRPVERVGTRPRVDVETQSHVADFHIADRDRVFGPHVVVVVGVVGVFTRPRFGRRGAHTKRDIRVSIVLASQKENGHSESGAHVPVVASYLLI